MLGDHLYQWQVVTQGAAHTPAGGGGLSDEIIHSSFPGMSGNLTPPWKEVDSSRSVQARDW